MKVLVAPIHFPLSEHVKAEMIQQEFAPTYPDQDADISYGLSDESNIASTPVYFYKPTPGAKSGSRGPGESSSAPRA